MSDYEMMDRLLAQLELVGVGVFLKHACDHLLDRRRNQLDGAIDAVMILAGRIA